MSKKKKDESVQSTDSLTINDRNELLKDTDEILNQNVDAEIAATFNSGEIFPEKEVVDNGSKEADGHQPYHMM